MDSGLGALMQAAESGTATAAETLFATLYRELRVMRGLIIDHARSRLALKRGGQFEITSLETDPHFAPDSRELVRIGDALDEIVDWKFFCGFSFYLHRTIRQDLSP